MAYKRISPQPVVEGGTGVQSNTAYAVLCGGTTTTNPIQSIAGVGTAGQLLTSNGAGALPTFQNAAASSISITGNSGGALTGNSFTFTGGTTGLLFSGAGTTETLTGTLAIANGGTNATSMATTDGVVYYDGTRLVTTSAGTAGQVLTSNGAGVAPTYQAAAGGVTGPGSSTDRAIATWNGTGGTALFNNSTVIIDSTGRLTNTAQPAFSAYVSSTINNVTGDGTIYTIVFDTSLFDQGSNFNTGTGIFTAPVAGKYMFCANVTLSDIGAAHTDGVMLFVSNTHQYATCYGTTFAQSASGLLGYTATIITSMAVNDTMQVEVQVAGGTKTVDVFGSSNIYSGFSGYLLC